MVYLIGNISEFLTDRATLKELNIIKLISKQKKENLFLKKCTEIGENRVLSLNLGVS